MTETVVKYSADEILRRQRVEFDYLWEGCNREQKDGGRPFDVAEYAQLLETMLLNRFDEAGLPRSPEGMGGIAGMGKREDLWPDDEIKA